MVVNVFNELLSLFGIQDFTFVFLGLSIEIESLLLLVSTIFITVIVYRLSRYYLRKGGI